MTGGGERIHKVDDIPLYAIDRDLIAAFCERLDRRMKFALSVKMPPSQGA